MSQTRGTQEDSYGGADGGVALDVVRIIRKQRSLKNHHHHFLFSVLGCGSLRSCCFKQGTRPHSSPRGSWLKAFSPPHRREGVIGDTAVGKLTAAFGSFWKWLMELKCFCGAAWKHTSLDLRPRSHLVRATGGRWPFRRTRPCHVWEAESQVLRPFFPFSSTALTSSLRVWWVYF